MSMPVELALGHLRDRRRDNEVIITNQSSARLWPQLSQHPLDFNYNPSTMGGAVPLGVGLSLARPDIEVIVLSGDGSLLMSLGCLVTAAASRPANLSILVLDNGMYEVTGGQKTAASNTEVDYAAMARSAGFENVVDFERLQDWQTKSDSFFTAPGPRLARLAVGPTPKEAFAADPLEAIHKRVEALQCELAGGRR